VQFASRSNSHDSTNFPIRTPVFSLRPDLDSPARRIPVSEATPVKSRGSRLGSPVRTISRERSRSVEPKPLETGSRKGQNTSIDYQKPVGTGQLPVRPHTFPPASRPMLGPELSFPLVPAREPPIPEVVKTQEPAENSMNYNSATAASSSRAKSTLRQPSSRSQIPRMGIKPYSRPTPTTATSSRDTHGKTRGVMRKADLSINADVLKPVSLRFRPSHGVLFALTIYE